MTIFGTVILIVLLSLSTYYLQSIILKKLLILRDSMKKVRQGNFNVDIDIRGSGEIGELAHHFRQMLKKINQLIVEAVNKQAATKEAELKSLRNQIDAHFLYNTLENLKMLAEIEGQYTISDALTSLGGMMRYSLKWTSNYVRLQDEIEHIKNYMGIMNVRYDDKLRLEVDVPPELAAQEVLKMSLQPIVENSVKHGVRTGAGLQGMTVSIRAVPAGDDLVRIEATDNGAGMPPEKLDNINRSINMDEAAMGTASSYPEGEGTGIGLRNVHQRIRMHYGQQYGIRVQSVEGSYTTVVITLPAMLLSGGMTAYATTVDRR